MIRLSFCGPLASRPGLRACNMWRTAGAVLLKKLNSGAGLANRRVGDGYRWAQESVGSPEETYSWSLGPAIGWPRRWLGPIASGERAGLRRKLRERGL